MGGKPKKGRGQAQMKGDYLEVNKALITSPNYLDLTCFILDISEETCHFTMKV